MIFPPSLYNFESASDRYRKIADLLNLNATQAGDGFVRNDMKKFLKDLKQRLDVDKKLSELGLLETDIPELSQKASFDACLVTNPKKLDVVDLERIYEQSI